MFTFAIAYLSLPVFLVLFTFFTVPYVLLSAVALVVLSFCLHNSQLSKQHKDFCWQSLAKYWPLLLFSLVVTYFCVVSPFKVWDWEKHYAVFNALVQRPWPPVVELNEQSYFLRYFPSWYVLPSLFAKIFDHQLLIFFMFLWTATGVFIALLLAFSNLQGKQRHFFAAALVFFLFSGLDIIGAWLYGYVPPFLPHWPQIWVIRGQISWGEIWPALTSLAWTPQHAVGGWIGAFMFLYNRSLATGYSAVIIVMISLWSALTAIGLIPIAIWAIIKEGYKAAFTPQNLIVAPLIAIPIALYLTQGAEQVPFTFVWEHEGFSVYSLILFCVLEFLLILAILYSVRKKERDLVIVLALFLSLLCLIRFGVYNDLLRNGAIPAICIISVLVFRTLLESKKFWREIIVGYLVVGGFPVVIAFALGVSPSSGKVDKSIDFKKMTSLYTYKEHPHMTYNYITKTKDATRILDVPLMRDLNR